MDQQFSFKIYIKEDVEGIPRGIVKVAIVLENLATISEASRPKEQKSVETQKFWSTQRACLINGL